MSRQYRRRGRPLSTAQPAPRAADRAPVASIALTFVVVVIVGLVWVGPKFLSFGNITIIGTFLVVPLIVGACSGFALLAGVVDLSIGSMVGVLARRSSRADDRGLERSGSAMALTLVACLGFGAITAIGDRRLRRRRDRGDARHADGAPRHHLGASSAASGSIFAFHPGLFARRQP